MQRPVMNPNWFEETTATPAPSRRRIVRIIVGLFWRFLKLAFRALMYDPLHGIKGFRVEEGTPTSRFVRGMMYRLAFVPVLIALTACGVVWVATHPRTVNAEIDPTTQGIYYEAVTFLGSDQTRLEGWLVPVLDAKLVLEEREKVLRKKHPAVVLVHDFGQRREQMLPLVKPLHDAGYIVLAINLRGGGAHPTRGETFGLRESSDVRAAVEMLRRRPFVDPLRVAVVGCGTGANAALIAASADAQICAVVAERPVTDSRELMQQRVMPTSSLVRWLAPLCKWTFEIAYGVDAEDLEIKNFSNLRDTRQVLLVESTSAHPDPSDSRMVNQIMTFLSSSMTTNGAVAGAK
jgi:pimeloyl-ACP methyl ester carboxylesterase